MTSKSFRCILGASIFVFFLEVTAGVVSDLQSGTEGGLVFRWRIREKAYLIAAPRAGFEPGTEEVASLVAALGTHSYYFCAPKPREDGGPPPLLSSAALTSRHLKQLGMRVERLVVVRMHRAAADCFALVGGRDVDLSRLVARELSDMGFLVNPARDRRSDHGERQLLR